MVVAYKFTNSNMRTRGGCKWELGKKKVIAENKQRASSSLCSNGWFHFYRDPIVGLWVNIWNSMFPRPRLFLAEVGGLFQTQEEYLKYGCTEMTLKKELVLPEITCGQALEIALIFSSAFDVSRPLTNRDFLCWRDRWLSGYRDYAETKKIFDHNPSAHFYGPMITVALSILCGWPENSNFYSSWQLREFLVDPVIRAINPTSVDYLMNSIYSVLDYKDTEKGKK